MTSWTKQNAKAFEALLVVMVDGEPTPNQQRQFEQMLQTHPEARDRYIRTMALHARLHSIHADGSELDINEVGHTMAPTKLPRIDNRRMERLRQFFLRPTPLSMAIAAVSIASLLALLAVIAPPIYRAVRGETAPTPTVQTGLARITGLHEAKFRTARLRPGSYIEADETIDLVEGMVEIRCHTGERLILQGPAELSLLGNPRRSNCTLAILTAGKLTAQVPKAAIGFTVETPTAIVVDLGTEFGILANAQRTEVHVLDGKVSAQPKQNLSAIRTVDAGSAARLDVAGRVVESIEIANAEFARDLPSSSVPRDAYVAAVLADTPVALWRLNDRGTTLARNSAGRPHGLYRGDVQFTSQVRPSSQSEYAATFDGLNDYVEVEHNEQLNTEDFTVEGWIRIPHRPKDYASIITSRNDSGRTAGYIVYVTPAGKLQLWTGNGSNWAQLEGPDVVSDEWTHFAATFQRMRTGAGGVLTGIACLYINGELAARRESMPYVPLTEFTRPLRIGTGGTETPQPRYYFSGNASEVAIYDRALSATEIVEHYTAAELDGAASRTHEIDRLPPVSN